MYLSKKSCSPGDTDSGSNPNCVLHQDKGETAFYSKRILPDSWVGLFYVDEVS